MSDIYFDEENKIPATNESPQKFQKLGIVSLLIKSKIVKNEKSGNMFLLFIFTLFILTSAYITLHSIFGTQFFKPKALSIEDIEQRLAKLPPEERAKIPQEAIDALKERFNKNQ